MFIKKERNTIITTLCTDLWQIFAFNCAKKPLSKNCKLVVIYRLLISLNTLNILLLYQAFIQLNISLKNSKFKLSHTT